MNKKLLVLSCSQAKRDCEGLLPALDRYDGPSYRVLRKFLRNYHWPPEISIGVLSAKYGLFGIMKGIENYDTRMDQATARGKASECSKTLKEWAKNHKTVHLSLGKDYLPAVQPGLNSLEIEKKEYKGPIGLKISQIKSFLDNTSANPRMKPEFEGGRGRIRYFLPDWDDLLDPEFDFEKDSFSGHTPEIRGDKHCCVLMQPRQMCDGVLVSLAQHEKCKGPFRKLEGKNGSGALSPPQLRLQFGLSSTQYLFGDCGAFSYVNEEEPMISVEQAVALYESYGFAFGASVDHIPVRKIEKKGEKVLLSNGVREERVKITRENAEEFISATKDRKAQFNPVGTIQALSAEEYAESVHHYSNLGYRHLAIGGLVPMTDNEIEGIARAVIAAANERKERPWIHLFGVFRPKLQKMFRQLKIDSFDSATYFRKAWLRSDQNYLSKKGKWYAALRVPMTGDGRTRKRLIEENRDITKLEKKEDAVLRLLCRYGKDETSIGEVLDAVLDYDSHLKRSSDIQPMKKRYKETLEDRPWAECGCPFCERLGVHILIFRGANRNKRRGAHNTLMLYGRIKESGNELGTPN